MSIEDKYIFSEDEQTLIDLNEVSYITTDKLKIILHFKNAEDLVIHCNKEIRNNLVAIFFESFEKTKSFVNLGIIKKETSK